MQNNRISTSETTIGSFLVASGSGNGLPPTNNNTGYFSDLYSDDSDEDILAPFNYEAFLRREGLA